LQVASPPSKDGEGIGRIMATYQKQVGAFV
jgi:hypothetical protein